MCFAKNSNWVPIKEDNIGTISESYERITKGLYNHQDKLNCQDKFIYKF